MQPLTLRQSLAGLQSLQKKSQCLARGRKQNMQKLITNSKLLTWCVWQVFIQVLKLDSSIFPKHFVVLKLWDLDLYFISLPVSGTHQYLSSARLW